MWPSGTCIIITAERLVPELNNRTQQRTTVLGTRLRDEDLKEGSAAPLWILGQEQL